VFSFLHSERKGGVAEPIREPAACDKSTLTEAWKEAAKAAGVGHFPCVPRLIRLCGNGRQPETLVNLIAGMPQDHMPIVLCISAQD
jgi:hypothetical protein